MFSKEPTLFFASKPYSRHFVWMDCLGVWKTSCIVIWYCDHHPAWSCWVYQSKHAKSWWFMLVVEVITAKGSPRWWFLCFSCYPSSQRWSIFFPMIFFNWGGSTCTQHPYKKGLELPGIYTPETNTALENRSSQKEFHFPTFDFQGLC